ncbi:MAG: phasin family protein [Marinicaulis sp.]|nr:phasin family protein [Marinicaulis sp.]
MATTKKATNGAEVFETLTTLNPESLKEGYEKMSEGFTAFAELQKNSMEAMMAAAGVFTKGAEKLASEQSTFVKALFEEGVASAKAVSGTKSVQEAMELNSEFLRGAVEKNLGQFNKVADICMETSKDAVEPLTARYGELVEKIQSFRP